MSDHRRTTTRRAAGVLGAALAVAAIISPAAGAAGLDPTIYDAEIPEGLVEHGIVDFSIKGSPAAMHRRSEYWATNDRWRSVTKDAETGEIVGESFGDTTSTTYYHRVRVGPGNKVQRGSWVTTAPMRSTPPLAGWTPPYNRKLVAKGLLQAVGPVTIAGIKGTLYRVPQERKTTDPSKIDQEWVTDDPSGGTEIALEDGTGAPLLRKSTKANNGEYGDFEQKEELVFRERTADSSPLAERVSRAVYRKTVKRWKAKAKAFRATARRRR